MTTASTTATVRVRYFAGARAAAGLDEETVGLGADATMRTLVDELAGRHGAALTRVLTACSFLLDGVAVRDTSIALPDGSGVDVLPPFAGG
ncbi:MAG: MoaD/ThiS family protein [Actinophytocola sp.]|uniref:MoaD/ThiS family protein n=1 Tax=Actinophytocola sp. TaxID=1872138 RepID=UPI0013210A1D|nr:MoaD/ThiS family protein [Actinophytocola sp.]MPZ80135.1 MoaD/ThiS family protein [Actinophytocola sp.]